MVKTSVLCPNCRQPVVIDLTRLFDLNSDPQAKEKLLSGSANYFQCPSCQFQGIYPTPIVYHDPDKLDGNGFLKDLMKTVNSLEKKAK